MRRLPLLRTVLAAAAIVIVADANADVRQPLPKLARRALRASRQAYAHAQNSAHAQQLYDTLYNLYRGRVNAGAAGAAGGSSSHPDLTPFPVDLPLGAAGVNGTLPVLVLPLPVIVNTPAAGGECNANANPNVNANPNLNANITAAYTRFGIGSQQQQQQQYNPFDNGPPLEEDLPTVGATSEELIARFLEQEPLAPYLPPAVIDPPVIPYYDLPDVPEVIAPSVRPRPFAPRTYLPPDPRATSTPAPRVKRSMMVRATLTVPRADYTEPYTAWFDESGTSRVDFHGGATSTVRTVAPDGRVSRVHMTLDRTGEAEVRRCGIAAPQPAKAIDYANPALPNIDLFTFAENRPEGELWRLEQTGGEELGAARGEVLTFKHELVLKRDGNGAALPVRYTVAVDSSVLGAIADGYEHRYEEVVLDDINPKMFATDLDLQCDVREQMDPNDAEVLAKLEPLREFTMMRRDPRHDDGIDRFIREFERNYMDDKELAVRKNQYVQHSRFVNSCNREGATFETEINFLGDRLDAELDVLLGTLFEEGDEAADKADEFPYSDEELERLEKDLPDEFDWRPRGAVTPVRYQGSCSSCWAFAVVGSVEGAHFIRTGSLVPFSEQCLVDCGHTHGANGCRGTWPVHAYNYVQDRGLPHREEYTPYRERVLTCRAPPVPPVTHISGHVNVRPDSLKGLKVAIRRQTPTVVVVDAKPKSFMFYKKGVLMDERCIKGPKKRLNHAVLAVGWGQQRGEPHFILKNTYSAAWGDGGYIRVHGPSNTCGVLTVPSYARLRRRDVDRTASASAPAPADVDDDIDKEEER